MKLLNFLRRGKEGQPESILKRTDAAARQSASTADEIGIETARKDIERIMGVFDTLGEGSSLDRAAQLVNLSIQVARNRLDRPVVLKLLYIDNPGAEKLLPSVVRETITKLTAGEITREQAEANLDKAAAQYQEAFTKLGVKPSRISVLFSTPTGKK